MAAFQDKIVSTLSSKGSELAEQQGLHLLRIQVRGTEQTPVIEVLLDGDRNVTVDDCEAVSRELSEWVDSGQMVKGNYRLDVMSPGIEEPLEHDWQFKRSIGRLVEVHYRDGEEHHTLHGHLREATAKDIALEPIHVAGSRKHSKTVVTEDGAIELEKDEQIYEKPVELVKIERGHITKVVVQPDMSRR
jgi:ribosome maturation factor RimP